MGATSYIAQCDDSQDVPNCVPKGRDIENKLLEPTKCISIKVSFINCLQLMSYIFIKY